MADLSGTGEPPHPSNHIVAGPALRLIHYYQSRKHASQYIRAASSTGDRHLRQLLRHSAALPHLPGTVQPMLGTLRGRLVTNEPDQRPGSSPAALWQTKWWLLAWVALLPIAVLRAGTLAETDTFWQIRTGLFILEQGSIPLVDPFSWTAQGQPWTLNSWGFNVVVGIAYGLAALPGVALTCAAMVTAAFALTLLLARRLGAAPGITAALVLMTSPLLVGWLSARPQLVDYIAILALALLLHELVSGRASAWILAGIGILTVVWVNLHSASLLGVAVTGATTVLVLINRSTRSRSAWCFGALGMTAAGSLANPYGLGLLSQTAQVQAASAGIVTEWNHINPADPLQLAVLGLGLTALVVAVRRRDTVFTAALGVALVSSILAIRLLPILLLLALPVLAMLASHPTVLRLIRRRRVVLYPPAVAGAVTLAVMAVVSLGHVGQPDPARYSSEVVQAIPPDCRVFNSYILGGYYHAGTARRSGLPRFKERSVRPQPRFVVRADPRR